MVRRLEFSHRHKTFELTLTDEGTLQLWLDRCLRKDRPRGAKEPQYVWTNVELEWEEHHYVEVRYWASDDRLTVTVNGASLLEGSFASLAASHAAATQPAAPSDR